MQSFPAPQQQQPPAPAPQQPPAPQNPLLLLPSMFHAVLCQTADVFNTPTRHHPRAVMYYNAQLNTTIPVLHDRFHFGLDKLELELLRAKAALRRDLEVMRASKLEAEERARLEREKVRREQAERERAEREEKERVEREEKEKVEREERERKEQEEAAAAAAAAAQQQEQAGAGVEEEEAGNGMDFLFEETGAQKSTGFDEFLASIPVPAGEAGADAGQQLQQEQQQAQNPQPDQPQQQQGQEMEFGSFDDLFSFS